MTRAIILRMNRMAEMRDPKETGAHVNRVAGYAAEIYDRWAFNRGIPDKERERDKDTLKMAAMLHDVGKVAISDLILKKPARFTPDEYRIMQAHTCFGARLFVDPSVRAGQDLGRGRPAAPRELGRHGLPRHGGHLGRGPDLPSPRVRSPTAAPRKLKGEEIPLGGRIVAVADVYDALISKRVYKEPWDSGKVYDEIRSMSGHQVRSRDRRGLLRDPAAHRGDPQPLPRGRGEIRERPSRSRNQGLLRRQPGSIISPRRPRRSDKMADSARRDN